VVGGDEKASWAGRETALRLSVGQPSRGLHCVYNGVGLTLFLHCDRMGIAE